MRKLRAIDLYSGVGGWSLGLKLAGIEVVASYERWGAANETNFKNNHHQAQTVDIRRLAFDDLPTNIDVVVGSPPCTQFSFSNRGGNGDIEDGLKDIVKFLTIVNHLKPRAWAMENVPRVASIILEEIEPGGRLERFAHLGISPHVVNMEDYGLPQRRHRCIAGNFDFELLKSYAVRSRSHTLGEVVAALAADPVTDPIFGGVLPRPNLTEQVPEAFLNLEEVRINRANKTTHTVYNAMPFPDPLDRSARTITATCTRVARESIVIEAPENVGAFRRLTIRERASLQGFPITFQFYGSSYGQKLRMVGNAIPPAFTYLIGHTFLGTTASDLQPIAEHGGNLTSPIPKSADTPPDQPGAVYPAKRSFRFAIPSLQLKSGVRFELRNRFDGGCVHWAIDFYFGTSKKILSIPLDADLLNRVKESAIAELPEDLTGNLECVRSLIRNADITNMQSVWAHKGPGGTQAFMLLDEIDTIGQIVTDVLTAHPSIATSIVHRAIKGCFNGESSELPGLAKLERNAAMTAAGLLIGAVANLEFAVQAKEPSRRVQTTKRLDKRA